MNQARLKRLIEFFIVGVLFGITEDILAIILTTDEPVTLGMVGIVLLVAVPFAIISELIVDHPKFTKFDRGAAWLRVRFHNFQKSG